jgi:hypothetical protein
MGIVIRTVGLEVGTGRGGMRRPASGPAGTDAAEDAAEVAGIADGATVQAEASRSASGPDWSQAMTHAVKVTSRVPRVMMRGFWTQPGQWGRGRRRGSHASSGVGGHGSASTRRPALTRPRRSNSWYEMELVRKAGLALTVALALLDGSSAFAEEDGGTPRATMTCERVASPGRVRCEVEARVDPGESISWGDVVLVRLPAFATALRGRVGPHDAAVREPGVWRWTFAVVARVKGTGDLDGRVRVVVCRENVCAAREVSVSGRVEVGD